MLQRAKAQVKKDAQVAPDLVSKPGTDKGKDAASDAVSEPVLKPEIKAAAKPKTKGADGRREAAEARREAAKKARPFCHRPGSGYRCAATPQSLRSACTGDAGGLGCTVSLPDVPPTLLILE